MKATIARIEKTEFENFMATSVSNSVTNKSEQVRKQGWYGWKGCKIVN